MKLFLSAFLFFVSTTALAAEESFIDSTPNTRIYKPNEAQKGDCTFDNNRSRKDRFAATVPITRSQSTNGGAEAVE